jgi:hypothetical protein
MALPVIVRTHYSLKCLRYLVKDFSSPPYVQQMEGRSSEASIGWVNLRAVLTQMHSRNISL